CGRPHTDGIRVPKRGRWSATREGPSVEQFSRIGIDLGKNVFHIHALESECGPAVTRKLSRTGMGKYFASISPCLIGMEACGSAQYWARELLVKQRTMTVNSLRGSLAEFGVVVAKGVHRVEELAEKAAAARLPETAMLAANVLLEQLVRFDAAIA